MMKSFYVCFNLFNNSSALLSLILIQTVPTTPFDFFTQLSTLLFETKHIYNF